MKKIFSDPLLAVFVGDACQMDSIPNSSIDVCITDPPYGIFLDRPSTVQGKEFRLDPLVGDDDPIGLMRRFAPELFRVMKPGGQFFCWHWIRHISTIGDIFENAGFIWRDIGTWRKTNPMPFMNKGKWINATEHWIQLSKPGAPLVHVPDTEPHHNVIEASTYAGSHERKWYGHSRQKPERVLLDFFNWFVPEDALVLDPFCGAGSINAVATKCLRRSIAIDIEEPWANTTARRHKDIITNRRCGIPFDHEAVLRAVGMEVKDPTKITAEMIWEP